MYKIKNQYENAINFFSPDANLITFNSSFGSNSGSNSNAEATEPARFPDTEPMEPARIPDSKETKAKAKKDIREKQRAEVKEKKRVAAEATKEKKRVEAEVAKERKRVEAEALDRKKIDDKAVKNVEAALEKAQISKCKAALLASNSLPKKKQQKMENTKKPVIDAEPELELTSEAKSLSED